MSSSLSLKADTLPPPRFALALNAAQLRAACDEFGIAKGHRPSWRASKEAAGATWFFVQGTPVSIVTLNPSLAQGDIAGTLIHEAVHVWQHYADILGEDEPGWETEAYTIQNIAVALLAAYVEQSKALG